MILPFIFTKFEIILKITLWHAKPISENILVYSQPRAPAPTMKTLQNIKKLLKNLTLKNYF